MGHDTRAEQLERLKAARLYLVTDERLPEADLLHRLDRALSAGVRTVQYRAKGRSRQQFLEGAARVQDLCQRYDALFVVNDDVVAAASLGAHGLHVGQDDTPPAEARRVVGPDMIIGLSVSRVEEAAEAGQDDSVDYLGVGAMYPTDTKSDAEFGGLALLRHVRLTVPHPLVAIGGITLRRAPDVWAAGADLIAVVSAVFAARDPAAAARALLQTGP